MGTTETTTTTTTTIETPHKETFVEKVKQGEIDTIDTNVRYLAYAARLRTALVASSRYLAYTSDIGEAFRPIVSSWVVKGAYGVSWAYLGLDVGYEGYKAIKANKDNTVVATMVVKRSIFQTLASMALPMFTIHSVVKYSAKTVFSNVKNTKVKVWGPTFLGLGVVPFLPFLFDHPVEVLVERVFEPIEKYVTDKAVPNVAHETITTEKKQQ